MAKIKLKQAEIEIELTLSQSEAIALCKLVGGTCGVDRMRIADAYKYSKADDDEVVRVWSVLDEALKAARFDVYDYS